MNRPAKLDFTFDVDDLPCPRSHLTGDAGRAPKGKSSELCNAETIDLPDMRPGCVNEGDLFEDRLLRPVAQPGRAANTCLQRVINVGTQDGVASCVPREIVGLDEDI